jgi:hypothetical protein
MNFQLDVLRRKIAGGQAIVYCYIIATIEGRDGYFVQRGSAPNFQGDLITLCTCKHYMRTFMGIEDWKGKWVAGFTGVKAGGGKNSLVYLMQVSHAFKSHHDLWFAEAIPDETKQAKAAHLNKFGDIYKPRSEAVDPFLEPRSYVSPCNNHVHAPNNYWHADINYEGCSGRVAALLVGDQDYGFLWNEPMLFYSPRLHRGQKKCKLDDMFGQLKTEPYL